MFRSPSFPSTEAYVAALGDPGFWQPYVTSVLRRHGLDDATEPVRAGRGSTFPTLVRGDAVIKLFGQLPFWERSYEAELAALRCIAGDPGILAPRLLAHGRLSDAPDAPWPYLVLSRMSGLPWDKATIPAEDRSRVAADLGRQVRRLQGLRPSAGIASPEFWPAPNLAEAAGKTVLPQHLVAQVEQFMAGFEVSDNHDPVIVHGDLMVRHVFVQEGRLAGIIDWGDTLVADPHYELAQVQLNLFDCDKDLLRTFRQHSDWPVDPAFARRALVQAFHRQAVGLAQHRTMDVFFKLPALLALDEVATLEELAEAVFGL